MEAVDKKFFFALTKNFLKKTISLTFTAEILSLWGGVSLTLMSTIFVYPSFQIKQFKMILNFQNFLIYATLVNSILIKKYHSKTAIPGVPSTNRLDDYDIFSKLEIYRGLMCGIEITCLIKKPENCID